MLSILSLLASSRAAFGANRADYAAYQRHCARRIAALRQALGLVQKSKKGDTFTCKPLKRVGSKDEALLLLFESERSWAAALRAKEDGERHRMLAKYSRAIQHARRLFALLPSDAALVRGEALGYELVLRIGQQFERASDPSKCLALMEEATKVLQRLVTKAGPDTQAVALEWLESLEPLKRISLARAPSAAAATPVAIIEGQADMDAVVRALEGLPSATESVALNIDFRGKTVNVTHAKLSALTKAAERQLASKRKPTVAAYEKLLERYGLAEDLAQRLVDENELAQGRSGSAAFEALSQPLHQALSYLSYRVLTLRIARDTLILHRLTHPSTQSQSQPHSDRKTARTLAAAVKLTEALISSYERLREVQVVDSDAELAQSVEARLELVQAQRLLLVGRSYGLLGRFEHAVGATDLSREALKRAAEAVSVCEVREEVRLEDVVKMDSQAVEQKEGLVKRAFKAKQHGGSGQPKVFDVVFNYVADVHLDSATTTQAATHTEEPVEQEQPQQEEKKPQAKEASGKKGGGFWGLFGR